MKTHTLERIDRILNSEKKAELLEKDNMGHNALQFLVANFCHSKSVPKQLELVLTAFAPNSDEFINLLTSEAFEPNSEAFEPNSDDFINLLTSETKYGSTALHLAARNRPPAVPAILAAIEKLDPKIQAKIFIQKGQYGSPPLHAAAGKYHFNAVSAILATIEKLDPEIQEKIIMQTDKYGQTALHLAARNRPPAVPAILATIEKLDSAAQAKIFMQTRKYGEPLLPLAVRAQFSPNAVPAILAAIEKLDPTVQATILSQSESHDIRTPLHLALRHRQSTVPLILATIGKLPHEKQEKLLLAKDTDKNTPLSYAIINNLVAFAQAILGYIINSINLAQKDPKRGAQQLSAIIEKNRSQSESMAAYKALEQLIPNELSKLSTAKSNQFSNSLNRLVLIVSTFKNITPKVKIGILDAADKVAHNVKIDGRQRREALNKISQVVHKKQKPKSRNAIKPENFYITLNHVLAAEAMTKELQTCNGNLDFSSPKIQSMMSSIKQLKHIEQFNFLQTISERDDLNPHAKARLITELLFHLRSNKSKTLTLNTKQALEHLLKDPENNYLVISVLAYYQKQSSKDKTPVIDAAFTLITKCATPLLSENQKQIILALVELAAFQKQDLNQTNATGESILHKVCAKTDDFEFVKRLIGLGLNPDIQNQQGHYPYQVANISSHRSLAKKLRFHHHNEGAITPSSNGGSKETPDDQAIPQATVLPDEPDIVQGTRFDTLPLLDHVNLIYCSLLTTAQQCKYTPATLLMTLESFFTKPHGKRSAALRIALQVKATRAHTDTEVGTIENSVFAQHKIPGRRSQPIVATPPK